MADENEGLQFEIALFRALVNHGRPAGPNGSAILTKICKEMSVSLGRNVTADAAREVMAELYDMNKLEAMVHCGSRVLLSGSSAASQAQDEIDNADEEDEDELASSPKRSRDTKRRKTSAQPEPAPGGSDELTELSELEEEAGEDDEQAIDDTEEVEDTGAARRSARTSSTAATKKPPKPSKGDSKKAAPSASLNKKRKR